AGERHLETIKDPGYAKRHDDERMKPTPSQPVEPRWNIGGDDLGACFHGRLPYDRNRQRHFCLIARSPQGGVPVRQLCRRVFAARQRDHGALAGAAALRAGLRDLGYIEGKNIAIEFRWAESEDQLRDLAADLVRIKVDVMVAPSSTFVEAARQAIPCAG